MARRPATPRSAGQGLRDWVEEARRERDIWKASLTALLGMAVVSWIYVWGYAELETRAWGAILLTSFAAVWWFLAHRRISELDFHERNRLQGLDGEILVARALEGLNEGAFIIRHDLRFPGEGNTNSIDHLVVGPTGIYVIETKNRSRVGAERARISGNEILWEGGREGRAIPQALANARRFEQFLGDALARSMRAHPIVTMPGWYIEGEQRNDIWVLNPHAAVKWIRRNQAWPSLTEDQILEIVRHIDGLVVSTS